MQFRNKETHPPQAIEAPRGHLTPQGLGAELYEPCAIEAVDAVILAKMARQCS